MMFELASPPAIVKPVKGLWHPAKPAILRGKEILPTLAMLQVNQLIGFGVGGGNNGPYARTYVGRSSSTVDGSSFTFSGISFGTAYDDRLIVLAVTSSAASGATGDTAISSVTIGGISATIIQQNHTRLGTRYALSAIISAAVPTGATGNVVVTFAASVLNCVVDLYTITGIVSQTPTASNGTVGPGDSTTLSTTLNVSSNGILIAAFASGTTPAGVVWTVGPIEDADANVESGGHSSASKQAMSAATPQTVTETHGNLDQGALSAASWA